MAAALVKTNKRKVGLVLKSKTSGVIQGAKMVGPPEAPAGASVSAPWCWQCFVHMALCPVLSVKGLRPSVLYYQFIRCHQCSVQRASGPLHSVVPS